MALCENLLTAFMMGSILLNPQLLITSGMLGALKIVLGVKRFVLYLAYVIVISLVIGLAVDRIL